jgi:hypothetical protein
MGTPESEHLRKAVECARLAGYCSSVSTSGRICNLKPHGRELMHKAEHRGGADDGKLYEEWAW